MFKLTMYFSGTGPTRSAWSEAYLNKLDWPDTINNGPATLSVVALINARMALMGLGISLDLARISQFPANRLVDDVDLTVLNLNPGWALPAVHAVGAGAILPDVALVTRCKTAVGSKLTYMAGLPQDIFEDNGGAAPGLNLVGIVGWADLYGNYCKVLGSGTWGCRTWKGTPQVSASGFPVEGTQVPPMVGVPVNVLQPWNPGDQVLLSGWRRKHPGSPGLEGVFTIGGVPPPAQVAPPFIYYLIGTAAVDPTNFKSIGKIGKVVYSFTQFGTCAYDKVTTRKRGVRENGRRGRSPASR